MASRLKEEHARKEASGRQRRAAIVEHGARRARRTVPSDPDKPRIKLNQQYDEVMPLDSPTSRAPPGDMMVQKPGERGATAKCKQTTRAASPPNTRWRRAKGVEVAASEPAGPEKTDHHGAQSFDMLTLLSPTSKKVYNPRRIHAYRTRYTYNHTHWHKLYIYQVLQYS